MTPAMAARDVVGRESDYSGASKHPENDSVIRMHGWMVDNFADAVAMKYRLDKRAGVVATIQEK